jgi:hypothetical protein
MKLHMQFVYIDDNKPLKAEKDSRYIAAEDTVRGIIYEKNVDNSATVSNQGSNGQTTGGPA